MNRKLKIAYLFILLVGFLIFNALINKSDTPVGQFKYVGIDKCAGVCHKGDSKGRQLEIWQDSKHSHAFLDLQTAAADSIANSRGFTTAAAETPQCVKCHVLGKDLDESELEPTFDKTQGVQCETCHGPGSEYKKLSLMKDEQLAKDNGMVKHDEGESFCITCHNADSPTFKEFKYDESWEKMKHTDPNYIKK